MLFTNPAFCHLTGFMGSMLPTKPNGINQFFRMPDYWKFIRDAFNRPNWNETIIHVFLKSWRKETVYLEGSMSINIKRDILGFPSIIYAHFLALSCKKESTSHNNTPNNSTVTSGHYPPSNNAGNSVPHYNTNNNTSTGGHYNTSNIPAGGHYSNNTAPTGAHYGSSNPNPLASATAPHYRPDQLPNH